MNLLSYFPYYFSIITCKRSLLPHCVRSFSLFHCLWTLQAYCTFCNILRNWYMIHKLQISLENFIWRSVASIRLSRHRKNFRYTYSSWWFFSIQLWNYQKFSIKNQRKYIYDSRGLFSTEYRYTWEM